MNGPDCVQLCLPREEWPRRFAAAKTDLKHCLPAAVIEHIGSTSVPGLPSKNIVDVLIGVAVGDFDTALRTLAQSYVLEGSRAHHAWLCAPSVSNRRLILHLVVAGGEEWRKRVAFRDVLRSRPEVTSKYLELKKTLEAQGLNIGEYTAAKVSFVESVVASR
ncbi:GrpB family protein [Arthrobacter sp. H5]|uniref:GrpB family protein n=1 Tax=Arthrobacter sp. H5 TaxID=1267973 RepID=UPI0006861D4C|nr:GrpB family protein [Arthrobacter sp. H5]